MAKRALETMLSTVLVLAAAAIAVVVVRREFVTAAPQKPGEVVEVEDWKAILPLGRLSGNPAAPVKVIEFADFECPFCRIYHATLKGIRKEHLEDVAMVHIHFPLSNHRFAIPAAVASECAHEQGRFWEMVDVLYAKQDSFGLAPWTRYAIDAGVSDTARFTSCLADSSSRRQVQEGRELADRLELDGTPTILVNGWRFPSPPTAQELSSAILAVKAGKKPKWR